MEYKGDAMTLLYESMTDEEIFKDIDDTMKLVTEGIADWFNWPLAILNKIQAAIVSRIKSSMGKFVEFANNARLWLADKLGGEWAYKLNLVTYKEYKDSVPPEEFIEVMRRYRKI